MSTSPTTAEISTPVHSSAKQTAAMLARTPRAVAQHPAKTKHRKINKQHPEFELTYDMMLGIRTVVSKTEAQHRGELSAPDYKETVKLRFPGRGSIITPAHEMRDFKFKDYCPMVFKKIRECFFINPADYLMCVCGNFQYLEFISNSKSGQFFFYTHDRQFMIKTMSKAECKFLRSILPAYYDHIQKNPNTLLTRFFGMHKVKPHKKTQRHFLIMGSVFYTTKYIHTVYDLKGSTQGRYATAKEKLSGANCVYKDNDFLDFNQKLQLPQTKAEQLTAQLAADVEFLRKLDIMDYSLLLGIHYKDRPVPGGFDQSIVERDTTRSNNFDVTQTLVLNPVEHHPSIHQSTAPSAPAPLTTDPSSQSGRRTPPVDSANHPHANNAILHSINPSPDADATAASAVTRAESPQSPSIAAPNWHDETASTNENELPLSTAVDGEGESMTSTVNLDDLHVEVNRPESASIAVSVSQKPNGQLTVKLPVSDETDSATQISSAPATTTAAGAANQTRATRHQHHASLSGIQVAQLLSVPNTPGAINSTPAPSPNHSHMPSHHGHTSSIEFKRQSAYGLPKNYNKTSKPSDIAFEAPEFEPVHVPDVLDSPRATRLRNDTAQTRTSMGGMDSVAHPSPNFAPSVVPSSNEAPSSVLTPQNEVLSDDVLLNYYGGICSVDEQGNEGREIYFMGIIDILTVYNMGKWIENRYKRVQLQKGISAVSPRKYAERFKAFIAAGLRAIPSLNKPTSQPNTSPQTNGVV